MKTNEKTNIPEQEKMPCEGTIVSKEESRSGTFLDNMKLPVHRWFKYSAGFSAEWVERIIENENEPSSLTILDPFAGSGTTLLAAEHAGVKSYGMESHPFVARIANIKLLWKEIESKELIEEAKLLIEGAERKGGYSLANKSELLAKCYSKEYLTKLFSLKNELLKRDGASPVHQMMWLAITAILRASSHVGTAQWQYVLPNKRKAKILDPFDALRAKIEQIAVDINYAKKRVLSFGENPSSRCQI